MRSENVAPVNTMYNIHGLGRKPTAPMNARVQKMLEATAPIAIDMIIVAFLRFNK